MLDPSTRFYRTDLDNSLVKKWLMLQAYRAEGELFCPLEGDAILCTVSRTYSKVFIRIRYRTYMHPLLTTTYKTGRPPSHSLTHGHCLCGDFSLRPR
jgi:hypothetical protein